MFQPYFLELDGQPAGRFFESHGGSIVAEVVTAAGSGLIQRKHLGRIRYNDIALGCGPGMSRAFYDWIGSPFAGSPKRKDGAIVTLDHSSKPISRMSVKGGLVTSVVLPELDKSQSTQAVLMVTVRPSSVSLDKAGEKQNLGSYTSGVSRTWRPSDFRLKIAGLEAACSHVTRIKPLNLGEAIVEDPLGKSRGIENIPSKLTFSDVVVEIPKMHADSFNEWFKNFVVKGNNAADREKDGSLDFLPPGSANPYFTVNLKGLGIAQMTSKDATNVEFRMYCDQMIFSAGPSAIH